MTMSVLKRFAVISSLVVVAGVAACAEDLTLVNGAWATVSSEWKKTTADAMKANEELAAKAAALAPIAAADAAGTELKGKFDTALAGHKQIVTNLEMLTSETQAAVDTAAMDKKIAPVQAAIDTGTAKWAVMQPTLADATTAAVAAFDALKAHADAAAAKAAADAAAAADPAAKDAETIKTAGGQAMFAFTFNEKNVLDEVASALSLDRIVKFMNTCEVLSAEFAAGGSDEKSGKARADAIKKLIEKKSVPGSRMTTKGVVGDTFTATVVTPCP